MAIFMSLFALMGCNSDGDETISLEYGNVKKMIVGEWVVIGGNTSGTPRILTFTDDGYYTDSSDGGKRKHPWRLEGSTNDDSPYYGGIYLDGKHYGIDSLGDGRIFYPGQVLGCNCSSAIAVQDEVDCYLFLGEGDFHPLAATFGVKKHVIILNPVTGEIRDLDDKRDRILRRRFAAICAADKAERFLVIVCGKVGQCRMAAADDIEEKLRAAGKEVYRLVTDEVSPAALIHYRVDAYVNTACPRIAMDDSVRYDHPMLTIPETEIVLGLRTWDDYVFDSI